MKPDVNFAVKVTEMDMPTLKATLNGLQAAQEAVEGFSARELLECMTEIVARRIDVLDARYASDNLHLTMKGKRITEQHRLRLQEQENRANDAWADATELLVEW